ncbi:uncharacterized protein LOC126900717 isoform X2 [Daktulosphaira vitifoliae]|nr:uncharacterized protein LOC126900717 isoform X2 [Daktulosphaira vitifoliae]XP_050532592.1 uncharacterized protein LOC126900717 isoform X2 [Daktulosphaira vitifoliae]
MRELKCGYGIIVKSMFEYIEILIEQLIENLEFKNKIVAVVNKFNSYLGKIFSALIVANDNTASWMWEFFMMLNIIKFTDFDRLVSNISEFKVLKFQIDEFANTCSCFNIEIPQIKSSLLNNINEILKPTVLHLQLSNKDKRWSYIYQYANEFEITKIIVINFLLDSKFQNSQQKFIKDINNSFFYISKTPISDLFTYPIINVVNHHNMIADLIKTSVAHHVWMHLEMYKLNEWKNDSFLFAIQIPLEKAVKFLDCYSDEFYFDLLNKLNKNNFSLTPIEKIVDEAKKNFCKNFFSLKIESSTDENVRRIELRSVENFINAKDKHHANNLNNYIDFLEKDLGSFIFVIFNFVKQSMNESWN